MPGAKSPVPVPAGEATSIPVHKEHIPCFHIDFAETWGDGGGGGCIPTRTTSKLIYCIQKITKLCFVSEISL